MSTRCMRNSWRGQNGLPARFLRRYILRNRVVTQVIPVLTPRRPRTIQAVSVTADPEPGGAVALNISRARYPQGGTHSPSGFNPAVRHTGGTGDTKADPGMQLPVSPRCTVEIRQPDNAPDPFGGGTGLPQPVFPKSFGHTPD